MKVLLVDDSPAALKIHKVLILDACGECCVDEATSGEEGFKRFSKSWEEDDPYDVIFLDINMPGSSGTVALKMMRDLEKINHLKKTFICMLTGSDDETDEMLSKLNKADLYLQKAKNLKEEFAAIFERLG
jgi:DNA-binding response OmpR family regulator